MTEKRDGESAETVELSVVDEDKSANATSNVQHPKRDLLSNDYFLYLFFFSALWSPTIFSGYTNSVVGFGVFPFLFVYILLKALISFPSYYIIFSTGQCFGTGMLTIWKVSPICKGVGIMIFIHTVWYSFLHQILASASLGYVIGSLYPTPPWTSCDNHWNTNDCRDYNTTCESYDKNLHRTDSLYFDTEFHYSLYEGDLICYNASNHIVPVYHMHTSSAEYMENQLIGSWDNSSFDIRPMNILYFCISWTVIFLMVFKGPNRLGKILAVSVGLCGLCFICMFIYSLSLGSGNKYRARLWERYFYLDHYEIFNLMSHIIYQFVGEVGAVITIGSYSNYHNNAKMVSAKIIGIVVVVTLLGITMMLSFVSYADSIKLDTDMLTYGVFGIYNKVPFILSSTTGGSAWNFIFFLMMFLMSINSSVVLLDAVTTSIFDQWPHLRPSRIKILGIGCLCAAGLSFFFLSNNTMVTVSYMGSILNPIVQFLYFCLFVSVAYGHRRFMANVREMFGVTLVDKVVSWAWIGITPAIIIIFIAHSRVRYFFYARTVVLAAVRELIGIFPFLFAIGLYLHRSTSSFMSIWKPMLDEEEIKNPNRRKNTYPA